MSYCQLPARCQTLPWQPVKDCRHTTPPIGGGSGSDSAKSEANEGMTAMSTDDNRSMNDSIRRARNRNRWTATPEGIEAR